MTPVVHSQSSSSPQSDASASPLTGTTAAVHALGTSAITSPPFVSAGSDVLALVQCYEGVTKLAEVYNGCATTAASAEKVKSTFWHENLLAFEQDPGIAEFMENRELLMATEGLFGTGWQPLSGHQYLQLLFDGMRSELQRLDPTYDLETVRDDLNLVTYNQMSQDIALLRIRDLLADELGLPEILTLAGLRTALREKAGSITQLNLTYSGLTQLPKELRLFTRLYALFLEGNRISRLSEGILPPSLNTLHLSKTSIQSLADIALPENLELLFVNDTPIQSLAGVTLPATLTGLFLNGTAIRSLAGASLPENLRLLNLAYTLIETLADATLPQDLRHLCLNGTPIRSLTGAALPENLRALELSNTRIRTIASLTLPTRLQSLLLNGTQIQSLADATLPANLKQLQLNGTRVQTLVGVTLPASLISLHLNDTQISTLAGVNLPANLDALDLDGTLIATLADATVPESLSWLSIQRTPVQTLENAAVPAHCRITWNA